MAFYSTVLSLSNYVYYYIIYIYIILSGWPSFFIAETTIIYTHEKKVSITYVFKWVYFKLQFVYFLFKVNQFSSET